MAFFQRNDTLKFWMDILRNMSWSFWDDQLLNLKRICQEGLAGVKCEHFFWHYIIGVDERWFFLNSQPKKTCLKKCMSTVVCCETTHSHYGGEQKIAAFAITPTESRSPRLPPRLIPGASTGGAKMEAAAVLSIAWRPVVRNAGDFHHPNEVSFIIQWGHRFVSCPDGSQTHMDLFIFI